MSEASILELLNEILDYAQAMKSTDYGKRQSLGFLISYINHKIEKVKHG